LTDFVLDLWVKHTEAAVWGMLALAGLAGVLFRVPKTVPTVVKRIDAGFSAAALALAIGASILATGFAMSVSGVTLYVCAALAGFIGAAGLFVWRVRHTSPVRRASNV